MFIMDFYATVGMALIAIALVIVVFTFVGFYKVCLHIINHTSKKLGRSPLFKYRDEDKDLELGANIIALLVGSSTFWILLESFTPISQAEAAVYFLWNVSLLSFFVLLGLFSKKFSNTLLYKGIRITYIFQSFGGSFLAILFFGLNLIYWLFIVALVWLLLPSCLVFVYWFGAYVAKGEFRINAAFYRLSLLTSLGLLGFFVYQGFFSDKASLIYDLFLDKTTLSFYLSNLPESWQTILPYYSLSIVSTLALFLLIYVPLLLVGYIVRPVFKQL